MITNNPYNPYNVKENYKVFRQFSSGKVFDLSATDGYVLDNRGIYG